MGNSPEVTLPAASTVSLAPANDSVDTNRVHVTGIGTINSFGISYGCDPQADIDVVDDDGNWVESIPVAPLRPPWSVTKKVRFDAGITLHHNPPVLDLLSKADRITLAGDFGTYTSDETGLGHWVEEDFRHATTDITHTAGALLAVNWYASTQTITIPPFTASALVRMWGGSGASGDGVYISAGGNIYSSAGVGAPGYLEKYLTGLSAGNTLAFTCGAAGAVVGGNGGSGSASTLASGTQTISTLTANGTTGTVLGDIATQAGSAGGTATGGDLNLTGQSGGYNLPNGPNSYPGTGGGGPGLGRGPDGSTFTFTPTGRAGFPGGLTIAWYSG